MIKLSDKPEVVGLQEVHRHIPPPRPRRRHPNSSPSPRPSSRVSRPRVRAFSPPPRASPPPDPWSPRRRHTRMPCYQKYVFDARNAFAPRPPPTLEGAPAAQALPARAALEDSAAVRSAAKWTASRSGGRGRVFCSLPLCTGGSLRRGAGVF